MVDPNLAEFDFVSNNFLRDELKTQYLTYIYSCAVSDIFREKRFIADYSAGYSMGIYAALVNAYIVNFGDGLLMIKKAYETIRKIVQDKKFGMCSIIGLSREDINNMIYSLNLHVEITNQNSDFAFVLSGLHEDVQRLLEAARIEGALHIHLLNVSLPYHSTFLNKTRDSFGDFIEKISFANPQASIISLIDQRILTDPEVLKEEVVKNLFTPLNWFETQSDLLKSGIDLFIECGLGNNLAKNSKFIEGDFKFYTVSGFLNFISKGL